MFRKTKSFLTSILIDFWLQLGCHIRKASARRALKNRYFFELGLDGRFPRPKRPSKTPQDGQNEAQRRSRKAKNCPKRGPRTAKKVPGQPQGSPRAGQDVPKTIYTMTYAKNTVPRLTGGDFQGNAQEAPKSSQKTSPKVPNPSRMNP